jgi:hypothetical protein
MNLLLELLLEPFLYFARLFILKFESYKSNNILLKISKRPTSPGFSISQNFLLFVIHFGVK